MFRKVIVGLLGTAAVAGVAALASGGEDEDGSPSQGDQSGPTEDELLAKIETMTEDLGREAREAIQAEASKMAAMRKDTRDELRSLIDRAEAAMEDDASDDDDNPEPGDDDG